MNLYPNKKMSEIVLFIMILWIRVELSRCSGEVVGEASNKNIHSGHGGRFPAGQNSSHQISGTVTILKAECNSRTIDITIPIEKVRSKKGQILSPSKIFFRADASKLCQAKSLSSDSYRITVPLQQKSCGSQVKRKKYQTEYRNEVVLLDIGAGLIRSLLNFTCVYQDNDHIVILPTSSSDLSISLKDDVKGKLKMKLHRDKSYSRESTIDQVMPEISVGHFVFVSIDFESSNEEIASQYHVVSNNCFASYFPTFDDRRMAHYFVTDGCASKSDSTVALESNGVGWISRWKYQMFKWVNTTSQRIYLFCDVSLCDERNLEDRHVCNKINSRKDCFGYIYGGKSRREASIHSNDTKNEVKYILSIGPIFPKDSVYLLDNSDGIEDILGKDKSSGGNDDLVVPIAVGVVAGVCVIILIVAALMFWRRRVARKKSNRQKTKKEIQQGFAFMMKSSNDPEIFPQNDKDKKSASNRREDKRDSLNFDFDRVIENSNSEAERDEVKSTTNENLSNGRRRRHSSIDKPKRSNSRNTNAKYKTKPSRKRSNSTEFSSSSLEIVRPESTGRGNRRRHSAQSNGD
ncbi:uncharacterized protein LOC120347302 [Styela clava]